MKGGRGSGAALLAGLCLAGLFGCARATNVRFTGAASETVWPAPPDPARIRYIGEIVSSGDLNPNRTFGEKVGEFLLGKEEPVGMVSPLGVCTDDADRVFIADSGAQTLHVFDLSKQRYRQWTPPKDAPRFQQPVAVAYDPAGRVLVSDSSEGAVFVFGADGSFQGLLGKGDLVRPCGLAVRRETGEVFIADAGAHRVVVLNAEGRLASRIGLRGSGPGMFNFPTHVAFDSTGRLYVSDSLNFRVQAFGPDGSFERSFGTKGDIPGTFGQPKGVAVDPDDHLYVVDANFEAVQVFDSEGQLLLAFGQEGHGPGEFWLPNGAFFDRTGRLWVADSYNRRVQVFQYLSNGGAP